VNCKVLEAELLQVKQQLAEVMEALEKIAKTTEKSPVDGCWNCKHSFIYAGMMVDRRRCNKHVGRVVPINDIEQTCDDWKSSCREKQHIL